MLDQWYFETYHPILVEGVQNHAPPTDGLHMVVDGRNATVYEYRNAVRRTIIDHTGLDTLDAEELIDRTFEVTASLLLDDKEWPNNDTPISLRDPWNYYQRLESNNNFKYYDLGCPRVNDVGPDRKSYAETLPPIRLWLRRPASVYIKTRRQ